MEIRQEHHIPIYYKDFYLFWLETGIKQSFITEDSHGSSVVINADYLRGFEKCQEEVFRLNIQLKEAQLEIAALKHINREMNKFSAQLAKSPLYQPNIP